MNNALMLEVEEDCQTLLDRALLGATVCAFGEDGFGKYGKNDIAQFYDINTLVVEVVMGSNGEIKGSVLLDLEGYSSSQFGHICSDKNFLLSIQNHLVEQNIDRNCLSYAPIENQDEDFVILNIDVNLLLDWA